MTKHIVQKMMPTGAYTYVEVRNETFNAQQLNDFLFALQSSEVFDTSSSTTTIPLIDRQQALPVRDLVFCDCTWAFNTTALNPQDNPFKALLSADNKINTIKLANTPVSIEQINALLSITLSAGQLIKIYITNNSGEQARIITCHVSTYFLLREQVWISLDTSNQPELTTLVQECQQLIHRTGTHVLRFATLYQRDYAEPNQSIHNTDDWNAWENAGTKLIADMNTLLEKVKTTAVDLADNRVFTVVVNNLQRYLALYTQVSSCKQKDKAVYFRMLDKYLRLHEEIAENQIAIMSGKATREPIALISSAKERFDLYCKLDYTHASAKNAYINQIVLAMKLVLIAGTDCAKSLEFLNLKEWNHDLGILEDIDYNDWHESLIHNVCDGLSSGFIFFFKKALIDPSLENKEAALRTLKVLGKITSNNPDDFASKLVLASLSLYISNASKKRPRLSADMKRRSIAFESNVRQELFTYYEKIRVTFQAPIKQSTICCKLVSQYIIAEQHYLITFIILLLENYLNDTKKSTPQNIFLKMQDYCAVPQSIDSIYVTHSRNMLDFTASFMLELHTHTTRHSDVAALMHRSIETDMFRNMLAVIESWMNNFTSMPTGNHKKQEDELTFRSNVCAYATDVCTAVMNIRRQYANVYTESDAAQNPVFTTAIAMQNRIPVIGAAITSLRATIAERQQTTVATTTHAATNKKNDDVNKLTVRKQKVSVAKKSKQTVVTLVENKLEQLIAPVDNAPTATPEPVQVTKSSAKRNPIEELHTFICPEGRNSRRTRGLANTMALLPNAESPSAADSALPVSDATVSTATSTTLVATPDNTSVAKNTGNVRRALSRPAFFSPEIAQHNRLLAAMLDCEPLTIFIDDLSNKLPVPVLQVLARLGNDFGTQNVFLYGSSVTRIAYDYFCPNPVWPALAIPVFDYDIVVFVSHLTAAKTQVQSTFPHFTESALYEGTEDLMLLRGEFYLQKFDISLMRTNSSRFTWHHFAYSRDLALKSLLMNANGQIFDYTRYALNDIQLGIVRLLPLVKRDNDPIIILNFFRALLHPSFLPLTDDMLLIASRVAQLTEVTPHVLRSHFKRHFLRGRAEKALELWHSYLLFYHLMPVMNDLTLDQWKECFLLCNSIDNHYHATNSVYCSPLYFIAELIAIIIRSLTNDEGNIEQEIHSIVEESALLRALSVEERAALDRLVKTAVKRTHNPFSGHYNVTLFNDNLIPQTSNIPALTPTQDNTQTSLPAISARQ